MKKKLLLLTAFMMASACSVFAQESSDKKKEENRLKFSGYIQSDFSYGQPYARVRVGESPKDKTDNFARYGLRTGIMKLDYSNSFGQAVLQIDFTEKGVGVKDVYYKINDPWFGGFFFLQAGIFDRPFGHEISYSSSRREMPERSMIIGDLFPNERDLGAMLVVQAPKTYALSFLKLNVGVFAGNGIKRDFRNTKDVITRLGASHSFSSNFKLSGGLSSYLGTVQTVDPIVFSMQGNEFVAKNAKEGDSFARQYFGVDLQMECRSNLGKTTLRGEYLFGKQPGLAKSTKSPNTGKPLSTGDHIYLREFSGGYVTLIQDIADSKHSLVLKYDNYDPNTQITGNAIGKTEHVAGIATGKPDVSFGAFGVGYLYRMNKNVRVMAYYEMKHNETSSNLKGFGSDLKDNMFTLRVQYKY